MGSWGPYIVCKACIKNPRKWTNGTLAGLRFGVLMVGENKKPF